MDNFQRKSPEVPAKADRPGGHPGEHPGGTEGDPQLDVLVLRAATEQAGGMEVDEAAYPGQQPLRPVGSARRPGPHLRGFSSTTLIPLGSYPMASASDPRETSSASDLDHCRDSADWGDRGLGMGRSSGRSTATPKSARAELASASSAMENCHLEGGRTATSRCTTRAARSI